MSELESLCTFNELLPLQLKALILLDDTAHALVALTQRDLDLTLHRVRLAVHIFDLLLGHPRQLCLSIQLAPAVFHLLLQVNHFKRELRLVILFQDSDLPFEVVALLLEILVLEQFWLDVVVEGSHARARVDLLVDR